MRGTLLGPVREGGREGRVRVMRPVVKVEEARHRVSERFPRGLLY